ncbi:MAG: twin-arginine translocation signal domain-containing protein [Flavobacteriaceae bacterium]|nr:twin-arginine translocation signal domain-containing protein [Flavobacteriaceae bacterium]
MKQPPKTVDRRNFIKKSSLFTAGALGTGSLFASAQILPTGNFFKMRILILLDEKNDIKLKWAHWYI